MDFYPLTIQGSLNVRITVKKADVLFNFSCHGTAHSVPAARWICGTTVYHHDVI